MLLWFYLLGQRVTTTTFTTEPKANFPDTKFIYYLSETIRNRTDEYSKYSKPLVKIRRKFCPFLENFNSKAIWANLSKKSHFEKKIKNFGVMDTIFSISLAVYTICSSYTCTWCITPCLVRNIWTICSVNVCYKKMHSMKFIWSKK